MLCHVQRTIISRTPYFLIRNLSSADKGKPPKPTGVHVVDVQKETVPIFHHQPTDPSPKTYDEFMNPPSAKVDLIKVDREESSEIDGAPDAHTFTRRARIFKRAREAPQSGWHNTKTWKIELDNRERWENPLIGYSSSGDPLSNISMNMDFSSCEDAIRFCEKRQWPYEVLEPQERKIKPKSYGVNFSWNKRTRVSNK